VFRRRPVQYHRPVHAPDHAVLRLAMAIACCIVIAGWAVAAGLLVVFLNRRVRRLEAAAPGPYPRDDIALLYYALSALVWVAALVLTIVLMREAKTARSGRVCGVIGVVHISLIVLLTCAGMIALAWLRPDWLPG
jgi:hypothetical protein